MAYRYRIDAGRIVILADDVVYGIGRMWSMLAEPRAPQEVIVVRTLPEALTALDLPADYALDPPAAD